MTNLSYFLKCEKVRCVAVGLNTGLTLHKEYDVLKVNKDGVRVLNDNGLNWDYQFKRFEPVIETAIQATNALDDTPMGTRTINEPVFEMGNPVYCPSMLDGKIYTVRKNTRADNGNGLALFILNDHEDCYDFNNDGANQFNNPIVYHATEENRQALQVLHPDIEFEAPPKELKGSDLCRAMLDKGWEYVPCYVSDLSDEVAIQKEQTLEIISLYSSGAFNGQRHEWEYAVPFDPKTGNVLTSEVLDD